MKKKDMSMPSVSEENGKMDEYQLDNHARTLMEAEELKSDPKKMAAVQKHMAKKHKKMKHVISSLDELRAVRKSRMDKELP